MDANRSDPLRWDDLRLLLLASRTGSFLAAGRELEVATSTVSRRLSRLEQAAGAPLLERRSDGIRLTEAGRRLAETAEELELRVRVRLRELPSAQRGLEGTIRVTAGDGFSEFLNAAIADFVVQHSGVSFEVVIEGRTLDLRRREADLAIRTGQTREGSLVYRTLGRLPYGLYASRSYVERNGLPRSLAQLPRHVFVGFASPMDRLPAMRWLTKHGAVRFSVRATSFGAVLAAARAGIGIAALPEMLGPGLERALPRARFEPLAVDLVSHPEARRQPHVRAFAELLAERFRAGTE